MGNAIFQPGFFQAIHFTATTYEKLDLQLEGGRKKYVVSFMNNVLLVISNLAI